jgi:3-phosphoshikimate 1-carboxyvinyltransferase
MASSKASIAESEVSGWSPAPPSKSYTLRGLMCAALSGGRSEVVGPLGSDDTEAAIDVLRQVGVTVDLAEDRWLVHGGRFREANAELHCRESAVTLRFMTAVSALLPGRHRLTAGPSLARRPVGPLVEDVSSQFISALLLAAPRSQEGVTLKLTTPLESAPYVLMTLDCLQWFGVSVAFNDELDVFEVTKQPYRPATFHVEGDWSSASYLLALGALAGEVTVRDLSEESLQGDKAILDFLQDMGASVTVSGDSVTVRKSRLRPIRTDLSDCTDLLPTAAALAALADGESHLSGIGRTRLKESDRVSAVREGLERMGIGVVEEPDRLLITGGTPKGATINSKDDHRIAMAFSLLGAVAGDTVIEGAECVSKTYPEFWDVLADLGVRVTLDG